MIFKNQTAPESHDKFVKEHQLGTLLNSSNWGNVKDNWESDIVSVFDDENEIVASSLLLIKKLPLGRSMIYCPRGMLLDYGNMALVNFFFKNLKSYAKRKKAIFIKFDPSLLNKAINPDKTLFQDEYLADYIKLLDNIGAKFQGFTSNMSDTIQPRYNAIVKKENFSYEKLSKKTQQFLKKANRSHPSISYGKTELLAEFSKLMKLTEDRKNINLRSEEYYQKLLLNYPLDAEIALLYINIEEIIADNEKLIMSNTDLLTKTNSEKKKNNYTLELKRLEKENCKLKNLKQEFGNKPAVSGALTISFGNQTECLYAGMNNRFSAYYPSYLSWYQIIKRSFENGHCRFNMGGIENSLSPSDGLLNFKKSFLPTIEEYAGEFNLPINKTLYPLVNFLYKIRKG